jgi:hypothetical protein
MLRKGCERLEYADFYAQELGGVLAKFADEQAQIAGQAREIVVQLGIRKEFACGGGIFVHLGGSLVQVGAGVTQIIVKGIVVHEFADAAFSGTHVAEHGIAIVESLLGFIV